MSKENPIIGFIGLGLMGQAIASNVQKNGWTVIFLDHEGIQPSG